MIDPIALATLTSAVSAAAIEVAKGTASSAGKDLWTQLTSAFGWSESVDQENVPELAANSLSNNDSLAAQILMILKSTQGRRGEFANKIADKIQIIQNVTATTVNF